MATQTEQIPAIVSKSGSASIAAGVLWLAVLGLAIAADILEATSGTFDGAEETLWGIMTVAIVTAGLLTVITLAGLRRELVMGKAGMVGLILAGLGTAFGVVAWAFPIWGGLLGIGMLIYGLALIRHGQAPRWVAISFGFGMLTGIVVFILLDQLKLGRIDSYGDYPVASDIGGALMLTTSALGSIGVGRWLNTR
jgi:hypothetical protein